MMGRFSFIPLELVYQKPHLNFSAQLDLLESRGVELTDRRAHIVALQHYGYYRLSAYFYPFRQIAPKDGHISPFSYRSDEFLPGVQFDHAVSLAKFDSRLRKMSFEGLEAIEIELRTKVAYYAGRVDPFIHLSRDLLDARECSREIGQERIPAYSLWQEKYESLCVQAKSEDFVRHFDCKYGGRLPIWVAIEIMDFGGLVRLYGLLPQKERSLIAKEFGVSNGNVLVSWVRGLNYMRNKVSHHSRLWNRTMTYSLKTPHEDQVDNSLRHLGTKDGDLNSVYDYLAVTAYLLSNSKSEIEWHRRVKETMKKFPKVPYLSPATEMGFPEGWRDLDLWA